MTFPSNDRGQLSRLLFMDDSGSDKGLGLIVYGWVEVHPADWAPVLRHWLEMSKRLARDYNIPVHKELHCTHYVNGRGQLSTSVPERYVHDGVELKKDMGRDVALICLEALSTAPGLRVGAAYSYEPAGGAAYGEAKFATYTRFLTQLDEGLRAGGDYATIFMDGNDPHYRTAHRTLKLDERHVIEDPSYHDSAKSQWTQMADLVAYSANISLDRYVGNAFGWNWYTDYLSKLDVNGGPQQVEETARPA